MLEGGLLEEYLVAIPLDLFILFPVGNKNLHALCGFSHCL